MQSILILGNIIPLGNVVSVEPSWSSQAIGLHTVIYVPTINVRHSSYVNTISFTEDWNAFENIKGATARAKEIIEEAFRTLK